MWLLLKDYHQQGNPFHPFNDIMIQGFPSFESAVESIYELESRIYTGDKPVTADDLRKWWSDSWVKDECLYHRNPCCPGYQIRELDADGNEL